MVLLKVLGVDELQGIGLHCTIDTCMKNAQMEILDTWKNKKLFVFKHVPREASGCFFGVISVEGGSGCEAAVTAFVPFPSVCS